MSAHAQPTFLFASPDTDLLAAIEPTLLAAGARVDIVLSSEAALAYLSGSRLPSLVLLDANCRACPRGKCWPWSAPQLEARGCPSFSSPTQ